MKTKIITATISLIIGVMIAVLGYGIYTFWTLRQYAIAGAQAYNCIQNVTCQAASLTDLINKINALNTPKQ